MRSIVVASLFAALVLAGCSSRGCGCRHSGCAGGPAAGPQGLPAAPRTAARRDALPGVDYARYVAAHERRGEAGPAGIADIWARTRQDGGAYFAGGGSSAEDAHMKVVNKA